MALNGLQTDIRCSDDASCHLAGFLVLPHVLMYPTSCRSQVAAYGVIALLAALFLGLLSPAIISRDVKVVFESLYAALAAAVVTFVVIATYVSYAVAMYTEPEQLFAHKPRNHACRWTDASDRGDTRPDFGGQIFHCPYCQVRAAQHAAPTVICVMLGSPLY